MRRFAQLSSIAALGCFLILHPSSAVASDAEMVIYEDPGFRYTIALWGSWFDPGPFVAADTGFLSAIRVQGRYNNCSIPSRMQLQSLSGEVVAISTNYVGSEFGFGDDWREGVWYFDQRTVLYAGATYHLVPVITPRSANCYADFRTLSIEGTRATLQDLMQSVADAVLLEGDDLRDEEIALSGVLRTLDEGVRARLEVELRHAEEPFVGIATATSDSVSSGDRAFVRMQGLAAGRYHWRARAVDVLGRSSPWAVHATQEMDFFVVDELPPSGVAYSQPSGGSPAIGLVSWRTTSLLTTFVARNSTAVSDVTLWVNYINCRRPISAEILSVSPNDISGQPGEILARSLNAPDNSDQGNAFYGFEPITWRFDAALVLEQRTRYALRFTTPFDDANCHMGFDAGANVNSSRVFFTLGASASWTESDLRMNVKGNPVDPIQTGLIRVEANLPDANFTISGPVTVHGSGSLFEVTVPIGDYTVSFLPVSGYVTPQDQLTSVLNLQTTNVTASYVQLPTIVAVSPQPVQTGSLLSIGGTGFGSAPGTVQIGGLSTVPRAWSETRIDVNVPVILSEGWYSLILTTVGGHTTTAPLSVFPRLAAANSAPGVVDLKPSLAVRHRAPLVIVTDEFANGFTALFNQGVIERMVSLDEVSFEWKLRNDWPVMYKVTATAIGNVRGAPTVFWISPGEHMPLFLQMKRGESLLLSVSASPADPEIAMWYVLDVLWRTGTGQPLPDGVWSFFEGAVRFALSSDVPFAPSGWDAEEIRTAVSKALQMKECIAGRSLVCALRAFSEAAADPVIWETFNRHGLDLKKIGSRFSLALKVYSALEVVWGRYYAIKFYESDLIKVAVY